MIRSPIAQSQCLFAQPGNQTLVFLSGPLRYNRLNEIADQERGMRQPPSLNGLSEFLPGSVEDFGEIGLGRILNRRLMVMRARAHEVTVCGVFLA